MSNPDHPKTGDIVQQSGVYVSEWGRVEILKKGKKFPKDPVMGAASWKLAHYPFDSQITSKKNIDPEFWNEIKE